MTRDKLKELQHDAALNLIAAVRVQMEYRRSTPLPVERMLDMLDIINQQYDEKMDSLMHQYYESNGITPCPEGEQPIVAAFIHQGKSKDTTS